MKKILVLRRNGSLYRYMHNIPILSQNLRNLANMCLNSMSMNVCNLICYFGFVNASTDIFPSDDYIWKLLKIKMFHWHTKQYNYLKIL